MLGGMYKPLLVIISIILLSSISLVSAECTVVFDKTTYAPSELITAEMSCDAGNEKSKAYTVTWYNVTQGGTFEITGANDTGTTPSTSSEVFIESFVVPANFNVTNNITGNLTGTNLEGSDIAIISSAGSNAILITDIKHNGKFLGLSSSVDTDITDENGEKLSGGICNIRVKDPTIDENFVVFDEPMYDGEMDVSWTLGYEDFSEGKDFVVDISCWCGSAGSDTECYGSDGTNASVLAGSVSSAEVPFTTREWLTFLDDPFKITFSNGTDRPNAVVVAGFGEIDWRVNITNNNPLEEPIIIVVETSLVNNATGKISGLPNEGFIGSTSRSVQNGTVSFISSHSISELTETGVYKIRLIGDVQFKGQGQVAQYIIETETFNVTSIKDIVTIHNVTTKDFFGNRVNTSTATQSLSTLPASNFTNPHTILTEAFRFELCINSTNSRTEDTLIHIDSLILENPTTQTSNILIDHHAPEKAVTIDVEGSSTEDICIPFVMPDDLVTHSDYRFSYVMHIGEPEEIFDCSDECEFTGNSDYFYISAIEDMIDVDRFITEPNSTSKGRPGIFIVNEKGEKLYMFNDHNYTNQINTDWGNSNATCNDKDNNSNQFLCDLSVYASTGRNIRTCFELYNYFRDEIFITISDISIDSDKIESFVILKKQSFARFVKSITDPDLYLSQTASRALEGDGLVTDGRAFFCTDNIMLPGNLVGGNNWDVQMKFGLDKEFYGLEDEKTWPVESDEYPLFGLIDGQPSWGVHLLDPVHYNIPEKWVKISDTQYDFNLSIPSFGSTARQFDFGEHVPHILTDGDTPYERVVNMTITYQNGSSIPYSTEQFTQFGEIVLLIKNISLSRSDNNFTLTVNILDLDKRTTEALEGIENKTGTFLFTVNAPSSHLAGESMLFTLTAMIESTEASREVEFECFIPVNGVERNTITWTKMLFPGILYTNSRYINVPDNLTGTQLLRCDLNQFSLGGQSIPAQDSFDIIPLSALGSIPSGNVIDVDAPLNISVSIVNINSTHSVIVLYSPNEQTYVIGVSWLLQGNNADYPIGGSKELLFPFVDDGSWIEIQEISLIHPIGLEKVFVGISVDDVLVGTWSIDIDGEVIGEEEKNIIERFLDRYFDGDDTPHKFFGMNIPSIGEIKEEIDKIKDRIEIRPNMIWGTLFFLVVGAVVVVVIGYLIYPSLTSYYEKYDRDEQ